MVDSRKSNTQIEIFKCYKDIGLTQVSIILLKNTYKQIRPQAFRRQIRNPVNCDPQFTHIVLFPGYFQVRKIKEKKQKHKLACQIMKKLVQKTEFWAYVGRGSAPLTGHSSAVLDSLQTEPSVDASEHSTEGMYSPSTQATSLILVSDKYIWSLRRASGEWDVLKTTQLLTI